MHFWRAILGLGLVLVIILVGAAGMSFLFPADTSPLVYAENIQDTPTLIEPIQTAVPVLNELPQTSVPMATQMASITPTVVPKIRLVLVGDLMLARSVNAECLRRDDFTWPYHETAEILRDADLTVGNLETPIVTGCPLKDIGLRFCADPRAVEGLTFAGFDIVSLANNHALNYEQEGLDETVRLLSDAQIVGLVDGALVVYEINGMSIGIIAFDNTDWQLPIEETMAKVEEIASQVDVLVGYFHWGFENQPNASHYQQDLGKALIDVGMDIVAGAHPHWLQPIERYKGGISFYSLGNFVTDQMGLEKNKESVIVSLTLEKGSDRLLIDYDLTPVKTYEVGQPRLVNCPNKYACDFVPTLDPLLP